MLEQAEGSLTTRLERQPPQRGSPAAEAPRDLVGGDQSFWGRFLSCLPKKLPCSTGSALERGPSPTNAALKPRAVGQCRGAGKSNARRVCSPLCPHTPAQHKGFTVHRYLRDVVLRVARNSWNSSEGSLLGRKIFCPRCKELTEGEGAQKRGGPGWSTPPSQR